MLQENYMSPNTVFFATSLMFTFESAKLNALNKVRVLKVYFLLTVNFFLKI